GDAAAGQHAEPRRHAIADLQDRRRIGAEAEIGGVAERKLLGVAAHQVPGDADEGEQQHANENVDDERTGHHDRQRQHDGRERANPKPALPEQFRHSRVHPPNSPLGRTASVSSSMANTTISPESAPMNWMPSDSATPIIRLAISAPVTFAGVPNTSATNPIRTKTWPASG